MKNLRFAALILLFTACSHKPVVTPVERAIEERKIEFCADVVLQLKNFSKIPLQVADMCCQYTTKAVCNDMLAKGVVQ